jgi:hypothetical protein
MSHAEEYRLADGACSKFVIHNAQGGELIVAQRGGDLMRVWIHTHGDNPAWIANEDALALGDWLTEARPWAEGRPGYGRPGPVGNAGHQ